MKFRPLVYTDTFAMGTLPHLILTALDSLESFDTEAFINRNNKHKDFTGVIAYKEEIHLSETDISEMNELTKELGKNLVYLVSGEYTGGWLFYETQGDIVHRKVQVHTTNQVNFDVWLEAQNSLWNPVDFLLDGGTQAPIFLPDMPDMEEEFPEFEILEELRESMSSVEEKLNLVLDKLDK